MRVRDFISVSVSNSKPIVKRRDARFSRFLQVYECFFFDFC